ncbi:MAG: DUF2520 domain-containing protein [Myxococcota bacterium]
MRAVIAGRGKVGRGLARALRKHAIRTRLVRGRTLGPRDVKAVDLVVLAVPDDAIASCAHRVAPHLAGDTAVVHCSGAKGLGPLDACRARGVPVAVMHPMVSFADPKRPPPLEGATFFVQGDAAAVRVVRRMAREVGALVTVAAVHGPVYHAAAVLVANATAALADTGVRLLCGLGVSRQAALRSVAGLLHTVAHNVERVGVPEALTGPVARGDAVAVKAHRAALQTTDRHAAETYDRIVPTILRTATAAGLPPSRARAVRRALGPATGDRAGRKR